MHTHTHTQKHTQKHTPLLSFKARKEVKAVKKGKELIPFFKLSNKGQLYLLPTSVPRSVSVCVCVCVCVSVINLVPGVKALL